MSKIFSVAQKGLILDESKMKILVSKYLESKYLPEKLIGKYCLPGGQIEWGEEPDRSFIKEIKEETGIIITPQEPFFIWTWIYKKDEHDKQIVAVARLGSYKSGEIQPPSDESETKLDIARWIDIKDLEIEKFVVDEQPVLKKFLEIKKGSKASN
jgi:8-oxo-dGTP pyrophosphatase MutT (NUDIX family)